MVDGQNCIREAIEAGERLIGVRAKTHHPILIEIYGELGFDYVWLDFEHGGGTPHDSQHLESLSRTCEVAGIDPLVRVPTADPALIRKVLDAGLDTVLVPRVNTVETARAVASTARFSYDGEPGQRGHAGSRANGYGSRMDGYATRADDRTLVGIQIEHRSAVEGIDELLKVPDIGFVMIGHGDLAVSLSKPMESDHPDVQATIDDARTACLEAGVPVGCAVSSTDAAIDALDDGYQIVRVGDEVSAVRENLGATLDALRALA